MKDLNQIAISCLFLGLSLSAVSVIIPKTNSAIAQEAIQTSKFIQAPSLISVDTSDRETNNRGAIYSFQIAIPNQAGASLQKVTISQKDPIEPISFSTDLTTAYIQEPSGDRVAVQTTTAINPNTRDISIVFNSSISAGKTVIVNLRPQSNPSLEGEYTFSVTAFTSSSEGQFIGVGRLGIYNTFISNVFVPTF